MKQIEINALQSFKIVKTDILKLNYFINTLSENQQILLGQISELKKKQTESELTIRALQSRLKTQAIQPITIVEAQKQGHEDFFVASKSSGKFHESHCAFAKNINPKNKLVFETEDKARKTGRSRCVCAK